MKKTWPTIFTAAVVIVSTLWLSNADENQPDELPPLEPDLNLNFQWASDPLQVVLALDARPYLHFQKTVFIRLTDNEWHTLTNAFPSNVVAGVDFIWSK